MAKTAKHILTVLGILIVFFGIPALLLLDLSVLLPGSGTDAVSRASEIVEAPSGEFVVYINDDQRKDGETLRSWVDFFSGGETTVIMEDICCDVAAQDASAQELARSFQSRLPENQMKIRQEDGLLTVSRAERGGFDILILSSEMAEAYSADTICEGNPVTVVRTGQDAVGK